LLLPFHRGADLRHDIGVEPLGDREQSHRDRGRTLDSEWLVANELAAKADALAEYRRLLRADRHGRLQAGELGFGQDELDERTSVGNMKRLF